MDRQQTRIGRFLEAAADVNRVIFLLWLMIIIGLASLGIPAGVQFVQGDSAGALIVVGSGFFLAGASTLVGSAIGFLFGVPRRSDNRPEEGLRTRAQRESEYRPNTNLEQISDWLTKMIVGIGLTQFPEAIALLKSFGVTAGPAFGKSPFGEIIAISLVVHYLLVGFFQGFLLAYLWLPGAFARAIGIRQKGLSGDSSTGSHEDEQST